VNVASATINPAINRFPNKCPHCLRKADGTYAITSMRGLDAFVGGYSVPLLLDVPVCRDAFARRRTAALAALVAVLLLIVVAGGCAVLLAIRGIWAAAIPLGVAALLLAAAGRTGWDTALLDRSILGLSARSVSSTQTRLYFGRDEYYDQWAKLNHVKRTRE
jgi:hypothetical protein